MTRSIYAIVTITAYERKLKGETLKEYKRRIHKKYLRKVGLGKTAVSVMVVGFPKGRKA